MFCQGQGSIDSPEKQDEHIYAFAEQANEVTCNKWGPEKWKTLH